MSERIKTLVITLLSITMVLLILAFFAITAVSDALKLDDIIFEFFRREDTAEAAVENKEDGLLSAPSQVALLRGNGRLYYPQSAEAFMNVYRSTLRITDEALGSASYKGEISQNEYLFLLLNTGVLYKYNFDLPFYLLSPQISERFPAVDANVKDMLICLENSEVLLVISSWDNRYYSFSTLSDPSYINTLCSGYPENGQIAATYSNPEIAYSGIISDGNFSMPCYTNVKADSDSDLPKTVISALGMNPYLTSVYRDGESMIYMEGSHRIVLHSDGHLSYFSEDREKGIPIEFDSQESLQKQLSQICANTSSIVHSLWDDLSSDFTMLNLSDFEETETGYILYFEAFIGGCLVNSVDHCAAAVQVSEGKIVNLSMHPLRLEKGNDTQILPFKQAAAIAPAGSFIAIQYNIADNLLTPVTVFVKEETP